MMKRTNLIIAISVLLIAGIVVPNTLAQEKKQGVPKLVLFTNVKVFNGVDNKLIKADVLVENNLIKQVSKEPLAIIASANSTIIDGKGMTLMPGLIDAHVHLAVTEPLHVLRDQQDWMYWGAVAGKEAEKMLLRGFTTVRDAGGPAIGLARAIDMGKIPGPRVYPSGPVISQTSGHGEHRNYTTPHPNMRGNPVSFFNQHVEFLAGRNLDARTQFYYMATVNTPAMTWKLIGKGSQYAWGYLDSKGNYLDGGNTYKLNIPKDPPAEKFWSVVAYDPQTRSELQTSQPFPSKQSQRDKMIVNDDGSIDLYFGPKAPTGKEANWLQTVRGKGWSTIFSLYGPLEPWFDKAWRPGEPELVKQ